MVERISSSDNEEGDGMVPRSLRLKVQEADVVAAGCESISAVGTGFSTVEPASCAVEVELSKSEALLYPNTNFVHTIYDSPGGTFGQTERHGLRV